MSSPEPASSIEFSENFDRYRKDARNLIQVLSGDRNGDLAAVAELGLNPLGLDVFLAAFTYELLSA